MSKNSRAEQLARLRELRKTGRSGFDAYELEDAEDLFDEVDEEAYKEDKRRRIMQDDFVVDDNGEGYVDDGREEEYNYNSYSESGSETDLRGGKRKKGESKAKRREEREREKQRERERIRNGITTYFQKQASIPKAKIEKTAEDEAFMDDLLGQIGADIPRQPVPPRRPVKSEDRRKVRVLSPPLGSNRRGPEPAATASSSASRTSYSSRSAAKDERSLPIKSEPEEDVMKDIDDEFTIRMDDDDMGVKDLPSSPITHAIDRRTTALPATSAASASISDAKVKNEPRDDDEFGDLSDLEVTASTVGAAIKPRPNDSHDSPFPQASRNGRPPVSATRNMAVLPSSSPTRPPPTTVDATQWTTVSEKLNVQQGPAFDAVPFGKLNPQDVMGPDGSVLMYWLDYTEVNGTLCLFGKVKNQKSGKYESAFLRIENIMRKLYFLPRKTTGSDPSSGEPVEMTDVFDEVDNLMSRLGVREHKVKESTRKYAFELPGIPPEATYLKLLYSYKQPTLNPENMFGQTYSHVFGTHTALFEQFVLWKNIMGPCWLKIENPDFTSVVNASWCKLEMNVDKPAGISIMGRSEDEATPPLTVMSLALRTIFNAKDNRQEVIQVSARVYEGFSIAENASAESLPCRTFSIIRPLENHFPVGFRLEAQKAAGSVHQEQNEAMLLSKLLAIIQHIDPDVFVGHRLDEVGIGLLLSRMRERKTPGWHRLGRLRRREWPKQIGRGSGSMFAERMIVSGRLICDLANEMGKSTMLKCQNWSLSEMVELVLDGRRAEIDEEAALKTWASKAAGLMNFVRHCETDTFFIAAIAMRTQLLPLTKTLTNFAGNSWARTLTGTRAERNEFILLHEFSRRKYICPDKAIPGFAGYGNAAGSKGKDNGAGGDADSKKKDKYQGGLVFEPEKGLYEEFILVMDFNSLYPSIIQEFNICFTTVDRANLATDSVPEVPASQELGILPCLISTLVKRRREVKKLMGSKSATEDEKMTWDIKQLALKLTANSMYGCLGYVRSRFYARPLAMLITFKGREILRNTKDLAEKNNLQVIYGDTDSVMINTHARNLPDALAVGRGFKKAVNDQYKLLEIDIDNVFSRLLLHAKKKYAAMNIPLDSKVPNPVGKLEVKGLDMKRREFCALSKETSMNLLKLLLSGEDSDDIVIKIHEYLRDLAKRMRAYEIPVQMYTIHTQLGKNPLEYEGSAANMPAVQIALREIAQGRQVKAKDVMSFVMTDEVKVKPEIKTENENGEQQQVQQEQQEQQASTVPKTDGVPYTLADVTKPDSGLRPNIEYYLAKQILPPVERLCAPIEGTNPAHLAECLGLDTSHYHQSSSTRHSGPGQSTELQPLESQIPDAQRFKNAHPPILRCRSCKDVFSFLGLGDKSTLDQDVVTKNGIRCPKAGCHAILPTHSVAAQVEAQIRQHTARYYANWLMCDDPACGIRTRQVSVATGSANAGAGAGAGPGGALAGPSAATAAAAAAAPSGFSSALPGTRCLGSRGLAAATCAGTMVPEYSERTLYNQLLYLSRLFDVDGTITRVRAGKMAVSATGEEKDRIVVLASQNRDRFETVWKVVRAYLDKNGRQWVDMGSLFAFAFDRGQPVDA